MQPQRKKSRVLSVFGILCLLLMIMSSCGGDNSVTIVRDGIPPNSARLITMGDFNVMPSEIVAENIGTAINKVQAFYNSAPTSFNLNSCLLDETLKIGTTAEEVFIPEDEDLLASEGVFYELARPDTELSTDSIAKCDNLLHAEDATQKLILAVVSLYYKARYKDQYGDFSTMEDWLYKQANELKRREDIVQFEYLKHIHIKTGIKKTIVGLNKEVLLHTTFRYMESSDEVPTDVCLTQSNLSTDCAIRATTHVDSADTTLVANQIHKTVLVTDHVQSSLNGVYYTNGKIVFTLNNWSGSMLYTSDTSRAPNYNIESSNGAKGTGVFSSTDTSKSRF